MGKVMIMPIQEGDKIVYTLVGNDNKQALVSCNDDGTFTVQAKKETMLKAVGGRGSENETDAWFTEQNCKTPAEMLSNLLEVIKVISE